MRIYKNKHYIQEIIPGISGFQEWDKREYYLVSGMYAQRHKVDIVKEFQPNGKGKFELCDGHLPNFRPITTNEKEAMDFVEGFYKAFILNPIVYNLRSRRK